MKRKRTAAFLAFFLCLALLAGCSSETDVGSMPSASVTEPPVAATDSAEEPSVSAEESEEMPVQTPMEDGIAPTVRLNSGYDMPVLGLGTWTLHGEEVENAVYWAICDGYRLIDTAYWYGNETEVGNAVRRAIDEEIVTREEIFITSKVPPYGFDDYEKAIEDCNDRLGLEYIDLILIHQSGSDEKELYRAIEAEVKKGTVRSLGISNYYTPEAFDAITEDAEIMPAVVQNENHIYYQNTELREYVSQYGTYVESWYPFGGRGHTQKNLNNETILAIAEAHGKTGAQVILRWQLQAGYIAIPGSSNQDHILENISIFDFELTDEEMARIAELHNGQRYESW